MNLVLLTAPTLLLARTQQIHQVAVEMKRLCGICEMKSDMDLDKMALETLRPF